MCRALADLEVIAIELLKSSLQSLCTGAVAPTGVRHEHHHPLPPLGGCLPLACVVVSAHCSVRVGTQKDCLRSGAQECQSKEVLPLPKENGQRREACAGLLPPTCSS